MPELFDKNIFGNDGVNEVFIGTEADVDNSRVQIGRKDTENAPILHTRMDTAGGEVVDVSGNNLNLTISGATQQISQGIRGGDAYDFDGVDDFMLRANNPLFDNWTELTMEIWARGPLNPVSDPLATNLFAALTDGSQDQIINGNAFVSDQLLFGSAALLCGDDGGGGIACGLVGDTIQSLELNDIEYSAVRLRAPATPGAKPLLVINVGRQQFVIQDIPLDFFGNFRTFNSGDFPGQFLEVGRWSVLSQFTEMRLAGIRLFNKYIEDDALNYIPNGSYRLNRDFGGSVRVTNLNITAQVLQDQAINVFIEASDDDFKTISGRTQFQVFNGTQGYFVGLTGRFWRFRFTFSSLDAAITPILSQFVVEGYTVQTTQAIKKIENNLPSPYRLREFDYLDQFIARWSKEVGLIIDQTDLAIDQITMKLAGGFWLDRHGEWFNVPRAADEDDDAYNDRIIEETIRPRANNIALEIIVQTIGLSVKIIDLLNREDILGGTPSDRKGLFGVILSVAKVYTEIPLAKRRELYFLLEKHKQAGTYSCFLAPAAFLISTDLGKAFEDISVVNQSITGQRFNVGPIGGEFNKVSIAEFIGLGLLYVKTPFINDVNSIAYFRFRGDMTDDKGLLNNGVRKRKTVTAEPLVHLGAGVFEGQTGGILDKFPVVPGSVTVNFSPSAGVATDDGNGGFTGAVSAGTINYGTGAINITSSNPADTAATTDYEGGNNANFVPSAFDEQVDNSPAEGHTFLAVSGDAFQHTPAFTLDILMRFVDYAAIDTDPVIFMRKRDGGNFEYDISFEKGDDTIPLLSSFNTAGTAYHSVRGVSDKNITVVADGTNGVLILQHTGDFPTNPTQVPMGQVDPGGESLRVALRIGVGATTDRVYVAADAVGIKVLDADPQSGTFWTVLGTYDSPASMDAKDCVVNAAGTRLHCAAGDSPGYLILDITADTPTFVDNDNTAKLAKGVAIIESADRAYVVGDRNPSGSILLIYDISTESTISTVGSINLNGSGEKVAVNGAGTRAYVADGADGIRVIDIDEGSGTFLTELGSLDLGADIAWDCVVDDTYTFLIVAYGASGMQLLDITTDTPAQSITYLGTTDALGVALDADTITLGAGTDGALYFKRAPITDPNIKVTYWDGVGTQVLESTTFIKELDQQTWLRVIFDENDPLEKVKIFIDGILVNSSNVALARNTYPLFIDGELSDKFTGTIEEIMISDIARG